MPPSSRGESRPRLPIGFRWGSRTFNRRAADAPRLPARKLPGQPDCAGGIVRAGCAIDAITAGC